MGARESEKCGGAGSISVMGGCDSGNKAAAGPTNVRSNSGEVRGDD